MKRMFFNLMDLNDDGKVCESDLFKIMKLLTDEKMLLLMNDDLCTILKHLDMKRKKTGKSDSFRLSLSTIKQNIW